MNARTSSRQGRREALSSAIAPVQLGQARLCLRKSDARVCHSSASTRPEDRRLPSASPRRCVADTPVLAATNATLIRLLGEVAFRLEVRGYRLGDTSKGRQQCSRQPSSRPGRTATRALATSLKQEQITGYNVEAIDGGIGKIDDATLETDSGHIVVDTGPWIFGKKVMLPAGVLKTVDHVNEKVSSIARRTRSRTHLSSTTRSEKTRSTARSSARTTAVVAVATATGTEPDSAQPGH